MAIIDGKGRLFGKLSLLDIGAGLVILMVIVGILVVPGDSGQSLVSASNEKSVEVDALVKGLSAKDPDRLFKPGDQTNFIIRNQPYGQVDIESIQTLPRSMMFGLPDGGTTIVEDSREENQYSRNLLFTLKGTGHMTDKGPLLGNVPIKVGTPVELEGELYTFRASVIDVRVAE